METIRWSIYFYIILYTYTHHIIEIIIFLIWFSLFLLPFDLHQLLILFVSCLPCFNEPGLISLDFSFDCCFIYFFQEMFSIKNLKFLISHFFFSILKIILIRLHSKTLPKCSYIVLSLLLYNVKDKMTHGDTYVMFLNAA